MGVIETVIEGTLRADGTLELDSKPNLPAGRVQVTVQPLLKPSARARGLVEVMDEVRAGQRNRGYQGRTLEDMQAEEAAQKRENDEYDRQCEDLWDGPTASADDKR